MQKIIVGSLIAGHFTVIAALIQRSEKRQTEKIDEHSQILRTIENQLEMHISDYRHKGTPL